jgi:hypothetical protein
MTTETTGAGGSPEAGVTARGGYGVAGAAADFIACVIRP